MLQTIVALVFFGLSGMGIMLMWDDTLILEPKWFLIMGALTLIVHLLIRTITKENKHKTNRLVTVTISIFVVLSISSFIYHKWTFEAFVSASFLMKVVLFLLLFITLYLNFVIMRAETSYKKKRGNQRIKEQPKETLIEQWKKRKEQKSSKDIYLVLGESEENEE